MTNDTKDQLSESVTELQKSTARKAWVEAWSQALHVEEMNPTTKKAAKSAFKVWWEKQ